MQLSLLKLEIKKEKARLKKRDKKERKVLKSYIKIESEYDWFFDTHLILVFKMYDENPELFDDTLDIFLNLEEEQNKKENNRKRKREIILSKLKVLRDKRKRENDKLFWYTLV